MNGIDAMGCDVFYEGGDYSANIPAQTAPFIRRMAGDRIPFDDDQFDVVISNQVMEHVPNLDVVVSEIARVLKPGGIALNLFPDRSVWREGHCGVPVLHRFPKRGTPRIYYAAFVRLLGVGSHREEFWFEARFPKLGRLLPARLRRLVVRKFAGMLLVSAQPYSGEKRAATKRSEDHADMTRHA